MSSTIKKILITIIVLGALVVAGYYFFIGDAAVDLSIADLSDTTIVGQDILTLTERLKYTHIDSAIFSDSLLANLKDFRVALTPEVQGRPNPFAQFGVDVGVVPHRTVPTPSQNSTPEPVSTTTAGL